MANWARSLRDKLDKLLYAGLKPDQPPEYKQSKIDSLLKDESIIFAGLKSEEKPLRGPLGLRKKIAIALGLLVLAALVGALVLILQKPAERQEVAGPIHRTPNFLPKEISIDKNKDLEVVSIDFQRDREPHVIVGKIKNRTDRRFARCEISFDVTTAAGALLGGVSTTVTNLAPFALANFEIVVPHKDAAFAMVRELRVE